MNECVNRALKVMRFTTHTGLKLTPFELHHGRKPRTELTNIIKDGKSYLSDWSELCFSREKAKDTNLHNQERRRRRIQLFGNGKNKG